MPAVPLGLRLLYLAQDIGGEQGPDSTPPGGHYPVAVEDLRGIEPLNSSMPRKLPRAGGFPLFRPRSSGIRCHGSRAGIPGCTSSLGHLLPARQFPDCLALCDADWLAMVARCSTVLDDAIMLVRETAQPIKHSTADQLVDDP